MMILLINIYLMMDGTTNLTLQADEFCAQCI
jgi:hypothetical protein